jgi:hypothetical protein
MPVGLVSAMRQPQGAFLEVGRTKAGTILCILLAGGVGALYYWLRIRPALLVVAGESGPRKHVPFNERWRD